MLTLHSSVPCLFVGENLGRGFLNASICPFWSLTRREYKGSILVASTKELNRFIYLLLYLCHIYVEVS